MTDQLLTELTAVMTATPAHMSVILKAIRLIGFLEGQNEMLLTRLKFHEGTNQVVKTGKALSAEEYKDEAVRIASLNAERRDLEVLVEDLKHRLKSAEANVDRPDNSSWDDLMNWSGS